MKKWLILLVCLSSGAYAPAAPDGPFEDDYYAEYMDGDYDDLYKYGFRMNNYASVYSDRFVVSLAREYGMPRADLRYYLRKGYSPSDLLFGLELSRRAGRSLRRIMELYYGSPDRNWTVVSIRLGLGPGSPIIMSGGIRIVILPCISIHGRISGLTRRMAVPRGLI